MREVRTKNAIGRYIVSDPKICHGQPTFRGTRVLVADVLDQVAAGMDWQSIIEDWHGNLTEDAIREAVDLANRALIKHGEADTKRRGLRKSRRENLLHSSRAELGDQHRSEVTEELTEAEGVFQRELMKEFERSLSLMSSQERLAFTLIRVLELPSRVAAVVLTSAGFPCTHTTAARWASDALNHYFPKVKRITYADRKPRSAIRTRA